MYNWEKSFCWVFVGLWVIILFIVVYWYFVGWDFSVFIFLSDNNIEQVAFNEEVKVYLYDGYDGQFFYVLVFYFFERIIVIFNLFFENLLDWLFVFGIRIDNLVLCIKCIGYFLFVWVVNGFGQGGVFVICVGVY